jgi:hypothetical protein
VSGAAGSNANRWAFSQRYINGVIPRAGLRSTLTYRLLPRLQVGVEVNPRAEHAAKAGPLVNWLAVTETANRPAVIMGTSSDRIGTPSGQSFYATASKNLRRETHLPIAPYFGFAYGSFENKFRPIGGLNVGFTEQFNALVIFDGVHVHPLLNFSYQRHTFSFILIRSKHPGLSYSVAF